MAVMAQPKKSFKAKKIRSKISGEVNFLKNIFSVLSLPANNKGDNEDGFEMVKGNKEIGAETELPKRARSITELEDRLQKIKSQQNFNLKTKLMKKSLNSKLNKKIKKRERLNKVHVKPTVAPDIKPKPDVKEKHVHMAKPVFNTDGKLVFSKFDFANVGTHKADKHEKDPKKILENIEKQKEKFKQMEENEDSSKVKQLKEKIAWKNILQKAEGQKVKDDPILLKKSIKREEQKKKHSKKQWEQRINTVGQKKEERQKKRTENINKKKKEKKSKKVKTAAKRGRVVI